MKNEMKAISMVIVGVLAVGAAKLAVAGGGSLMVPTAELKWNDVPGFTGVQLATADGDPGKGPAHFFLKFTAGFAAPLHHHTANHSGTVVAGTLALTVDGKETMLPPGSFFEFSNKTPHMTKCEAGADCVLSMDVRGKWDVVPEKAATKK
jgi:quercetin dioxygenase-like cupin family protein